MHDGQWRNLDDEGLEQLLVERWLYRGLMLGVILIAAVGASYLGVRGVVTAFDWVTIGILLTIAFSAGVVAYIMRQADLKIHRELRRRRVSPSQRLP